jgi:hypothetical protein
MTVNSPINGYPRALFDPNYIPPKLLHRTREIKSLWNLFRSSLNPDDYFNLNAYIYGIHGVGKTVFARYFVGLLKNKFQDNFIDIYLDLALKSPDENLRLLVEEYSHLISQEFTFLPNTQKLWSYFHFLRKKVDMPLILILDNVNMANQTLYEKIIRYSKDLKFSIITTSQIPFSDCRKNSELFAQYLDFSLPLEMYSSSALLDILTQRISLAFPSNLETNLTKYIVDIVTEFDLYRPSTCINLLKDIYQHLIHGRDITPSMIRDSSMDLVEFPYHEDLKCLLDFDESPIDLFYLPLLEKLAIYFNESSNIYINSKELTQLYRVSCDELELPYNQNQFQKFLEKLLLNGFLYASKFKSNSEYSFFMIIDPNLLLEYLEIKF